MVFLFTRHLQRDRVLLVVDSHHHLAAVQTRVAGTEPGQSQAGVVAVLIVAGQRDATLEGLFHLWEEKKEEEEEGWKYQALS